MRERRDLYATTVRKTGRLEWALRVLDAEKGGPGANRSQLACSGASSSQLACPGN